MSRNEEGFKAGRKRGACSWFCSEVGMCSKEELPTVALSLANRAGFTLDVAAPRQGAGFLSCFLRPEHR